ncbi:unnamed protein product [Arabidopsis halleri]
MNLNCLKTLERQKTSEVWLHFVQSKPTDVKARCIHCSELISCKTKDAMGKHMRICKMMPREVPDG